MILLFDYWFFWKTCVINMNYFSNYKCKRITWNLHIKNWCNNWYRYYCTFNLESITWVSKHSCVIFIKMLRDITCQGYNQPWNMVCTGMNSHNTFLDFMEWRCVKTRERTKRQSVRQPEWQDRSTSLDFRQWNRCRGMFTALAVRLR